MPAAPDRISTPDISASARLLAELFAAPATLLPVLSALDRAEADSHTGLRLADAGLRHALRSCGLASEAAEADLPSTPLVLDGDWLCTRRTWGHERGLAHHLLTRSRRRTGLDAATRAAIAARFPSSAIALSQGGEDWQLRALLTALSRGLTLITGGPGCGKTEVAGRIAAVVAQQAVANGAAVPVVVLAAPTGKASARLAEAVRDAAARAGLDDDSARAITAWPSTLTRLFSHPGTASVDLAIIDEISMATAAQLHRVLERLPATARVVLLGDPDQLASVEAGRVLGDLATTPALLAEGTLVRLRVNWRSGAAPALAALVADLQAGDDALACERLELPPDAGATWVMRRDLPASPTRLVRDLLALHAPWLKALAGAADAEAALALAAQVRLLAVLRQGDWGADALNAGWERALLQHRGHTPDAHGNYPGRLLLVTRNRPDLALSNGDVGIVWPGANGLEARFAAVGGTRALPLHRLDGAEPAWFLTVHKAQGTQGDHVEVVGLPPDASPGQRQLASREMAYTAITRAAARLRVWWDANGLATALSQRDRERRRSGLRRHLLRASGNNPGI